MKLTELIKNNYKKLSSKTREKINYEKEHFTSYPFDYIQEKFVYAGMILEGSKYGHMALNHVVNNPSDNILGDACFSVIGLLGGAVIGCVEGFAAGYVPAKVARKVIGNAIPPDIVLIEKNNNGFMIQYNAKPFDLKRKEVKNVAKDERYELKNGQFMKMNEEQIYAELQPPRIRYTSGEEVNARTEEQLFNYIRETPKAKGKEAYLLNEDMTWEKLN